MTWKVVFIVWAFWAQKSTLFASEAMQMDHTLKTFNSCILTCFIVYNSVGVTITQSAYIKVDVLLDPCRRVAAGNF